MESTEKQGNALAGTGVGLGAGALGLLLLQNGGLGGLLGNNRPPMEPPATQRDLGYERQLTEKDSEIGQLKAQQYADAAVLAAERRLADKIEKIETQQAVVNNAQREINTRQSDLIGSLRGQIDYLTSMTAPYIRGPIMAASEAAWNAMKPTAASAATAG